MRTNGPGIYDAETLEMLVRLEADGVLLFVHDGVHGNGVSVKGSIEFMQLLPSVLERMAVEIRKDLAAGTVTPPHGKHN